MTSPSMEDVALDGVEMGSAVGDALAAQVAGESGGAGGAGHAAVPDGCAVNARSDSF